MREVLVAEVDDIPDGDRKTYSVDGVEIGIFRVGDQVYAWRNECPHQGGPVCQGKLLRSVEERLDDQRRSLGIHYVDGTLNIICPWHGYEFDVRTGRYAGGASLRLKPQRIRLSDGRIYVSLDA